MTARPAPAHLPVHDAVVLAGGHGRRLGGVSKAEVRVAGVAMIDRVLTAARAARHVVIVGPDELARPGIPTTLERPASGGPVAGIDAGLAALVAAADDDAPVLVLACDVPRVAGVVPALFAALAAAPGADGVHLVDAEGHPQLVAVYRRPALARALASFAEPAAAEPDTGPAARRRATGEADRGVHGVSVRRLAGKLAMVALADRDGHGQDADTWDDVRRLDAVISRGEGVAERQSDQPGDDQRDERELRRWVQLLGRELAVDPDGVDVELLLGLSREVAHGVARPAVPLTGFLVGYAVGRGGGDRQALERVAARATALVRQWPGDGPAGDDAAPTS